MIVNKHRMSDEKMIEALGKERQLQLEEQMTQYDENNAELMERAFLGTASANEVGGSVAYNAGVPLPVAQSVAKGLDSAKDLFLSDSDMMKKYGQNYDAHVQQIEDNVAKSYDAAYKQELSQERAKRSIEDVYEATAYNVKSDKSKRSEKLGDSIAELGDVSGTMVDDVFDFLT